MSEDDVVAMSGSLLATGSTS